MVGKHTADIQQTYNEHTAKIWRTYSEHMSKTAVDIRRTYSEYTPISYVSFPPNIQWTYDGHDMPIYDMSVSHQNTTNSAPIAN